MNALLRKTIGLALVTVTLTVQAFAQSPVSQGGDSVILPELKGIAFVGGSVAVQPKGIASSGLTFGNIAMLEKPAFASLMEPYIGHPLTSQKLKDITSTVVSFYRKQNHPLADVVIPEQDLQSGTLQVMVTEYRVGEVRAEGNRWFSDNVLTSAVNLNHGDSIDSHRLLGRLDSANANPFRRVDLIYAPSKQPGFTDLVLHTEDRFPLRVFTGMDDSGVPSLGRSRWNAGVNWGNAFGHDQQLSYQFSSSTNLFLGSNQAPGEPHGASFLSHSVSWTSPLPWHDSVTIFGSYERSIPNIGQSFGMVGHSGQASIRYNHALPRTDALPKRFR